MKLSRNQLTLIGLVIILHLLTSCSKGIRGIKGDGPVITEEIQLSDIDGISLAASGNVYVSYSTTQEVTIKSHQNIIDNMEWEVHNKHLTIDFDKKVRDYETLDIYISVDVLKSLGISGSGDVKTTSLFESNHNFSAKISGSGDMDININSPKVELITSGSGDLDIYTDTEYLSGKISGTGNYYLSGSAESTYYSISGSGDISGFSLNTENADINISGSGNIDLLVSDYLGIKISGSGDVHYKGWPTISKSISGSGKVVSAN